MPTLLVTLGGTMLVAMVSKRLIEDPFIAVGRRWIRARDAARPATTEH